MGRQKSKGMGAGRKGALELPVCLGRRERNRWEKICVPLTRAGPVLVLGRPVSMCTWLPGAVAG